MRNIFKSFATILSIALVFSLVFMLPSFVIPISENLMKRINPEEMQLFFPLLILMHFDLGIFKHEVGHSIICSKVGKNPNPFFDEGFRQYTDYFFSSEAYENDLKIFKENADLLSPDLVLSTNNLFFKSMLNYSLSGVFVKHVIDRIGLEKFKIAYAQNSINTTFQNNVLSLEHIIDEFKRLYGSNNDVK